MNSLPFGISGYKLIRTSKNDRTYVIECVKETLLPSVGNNERKMSELWINSTLERVDHLMEIDDGNESFILKNGCEKAGFIWMSHGIDQFTTDPVGCLNGIFVREDLRRNGIGTELMKSAYKWCSLHGYITITLNVGAPNIGAMTFYNNMGFKPQSIVMNKTLI